MKKGLRRHRVLMFTSSQDSNRRPDEEGIKTRSSRSPHIVCYSNRRPDEEGIKTDARGRGGRGARIPTADLMKKGLRPLFDVPVWAALTFQPQT